MKHCLEMKTDGDIAIYKKQGDLKVRVMHISFNPGESLLENLIFAYFALTGFDNGFDFDKAKSYANTCMKTFLGDIGA